MKRGTLDTLPDAPEITVTDTAAGERFPFAVAVGGQVLILWHEDAGNTWQFKWYNVANVTIPSARRTGFRPLCHPGGDLHAARDSTNTVWVAFSDHPARLPTAEINVIAVPPGQQPGRPNC